jgi:hypothetical protein
MYIYNSGIYCLYTAYIDIKKRRGSEILSHAFLPSTASPEPFTGGTLFSVRAVLTGFVTTFAIGHIPFSQFINHSPHLPSPIHLLASLLVWWVFLPSF